MNNSPACTAPRRAKLNKPVVMQRAVDTEAAIELLEHFTDEVRKEIRKRSKVVVKSDFYRSKIQVVSFINKDFCLTVNFSEGMQI